MYTISTQLAKAVFNIGDFFYKDNPTESIQIENGIITYTVGKSSFDKPVDTFFFMCKDWAFNRPNTTMHTMYDLRPRTTNRIDYNCDIVEDCGYGKTIKTMYSNSEQQAIFDACQWILDTKGV